MTNTAQNDLTMNMRANPTTGLALLILLAMVSVCFGQPVITNQPAFQATAPGTVVSFQVGASSPDPPAYQWQKNSGNGFSALADQTNAALVLSNVQPWDAGDFRVVVSSALGVTTSAVARLYVVRPALTTTNLVIDNFDDNKLTSWVSEGHKGQVKLSETNQQFRVWGYWPGIDTMGMDLTDSESYGSRARGWSALNGQTVEWRVDLVAMNEHATMAGFALWSATTGAAYVLFKGHDFVHLCKPNPSVNEMHGHFFHDKVQIRDSNVVLSLAVTRMTPNAIVTIRILDKENNNAVLYERSAVDTPGTDRTLTRTELEAASGMHLHSGMDAGPPILSGTDVLLTVFQYNDGTRPPAEVTYDNLERRTSAFPVWHPEIAIQAPATPSSKLNLTLSAAPKSSWAIERALAPTGPWTDISTLVIETNASVQFQDTPPPDRIGFYRARLQ